MTRDEAKRKLIDAALILNDAGLGDFTRGHVSVRVPGDDKHFFMKPHSFGLDELTMENIVTCDMAGEKVGGLGRRHSEVYIHSEIFKVRPDVGAIIHAHPKYSVAFSTLDIPLLPLSQAGAEFWDGVGVYADTIDLIRSQQMGADLARTLGKHKAVFLQGHGVTVVGKTLEQCVILCMTLENACEMQLIVESTGRKPKLFPIDDIKKLADKMSVPEIYDVNFDYLARTARAKRRG
jgi:L-fuculose-phosphate aldolase